MLAGRPCNKHKLDKTDDETEKKYHRLVDRCCVSLKFAAARSDGIRPPPRRRRLVLPAGRHLSPRPLPAFIIPSDGCLIAELFFPILNPEYGVPLIPTPPEAAARAMRPPGRDPLTRI